MSGYPIDDDDDEMDNYYKSDYDFTSASTILDLTNIPRIIKRVTLKMMIQKTLANQ